MKFLALAVFFLPIVWAASAPFQCKILAKSAYFTADGPAETIEFFNVSKVSAGDNAYYIQRDGHPYLGDDISSDDSFEHERFDLVRCQQRSSDSSLPKSYLRVHLSKDTSQCLTLAGPGIGTNQKIVKEGFTEENTMLMKPCEHTSSSTFMQQIFKDQKQNNYPYFLETIGSDKEAARFFVGFQDHKVFLMANEPKSGGSPPGNFKLYIDKFA
ncbi:hypothetical protein MNAN1_003477 [Malassezia nana]|uniref:Uncharacterized protein n=1 Tax=Malassezia nana TaxID=180528 RepID=A0AAF0EPL7_9BASI|nr:hypothetical protein MNAN1_003477 [Malassezia nana]